MKVVVKEVVNDGNVFNLLEAVRDVCNEEGQPELGQEIQNKVLTFARDFKSALEIIREFVEVKSVVGK